jgi:lipopolysaccharide export system permease protein
VKKLDKLALLYYVAPFISTLVVCLFFLLMQFLWKYIDDLVGKGLDISVIFQLLFYASASLVTMALPLAALLSGIMTMGNIAESNELMAFKSTGISMIRVFRPVVILIVFLSIGSYFFANNVLPIANLKFQTLFYDIKSKKLALDIKPGIFYDGIDGYRLRIGQKNDDNNDVKDVLIYDHTSGTGNNIVIKAESGNLYMSPDSKWLYVKLYNGNRYEEISGQNDEYHNKPASRLHFKEYEIKFDLSSFQFSRTNTALFKGGYKMLNLKQLQESIDSVNNIMIKQEPITLKYLQPYYFYLRDTTFNYTEARPINFTGEYFIDNFPKNKQDLILNKAIAISRNIKQVLIPCAMENNMYQRSMINFYIEWHKKIILAFTVFSLFLIGAPLGAIIRKGGLGLPAVISTFLFILYYVISLIGEKLAKQLILTPFWGMWLPVFLMLPLGVFLIYKANNDSKLFSLDAYQSRVNRIKSFLHIKSKRTLFDGRQSA